MNSMDMILTGAIAMASATISLFFFAFWRSTRDRFFLLFGASFLLEGVNRLLIGLSSFRDEDEPLYYLIRLVAYGLILIAILDKNRGNTKD
jgi:uncharacterized membrane protein HdeD (DUF308 family)